MRSRTAGIIDLKLRARTRAQALVSRLANQTLANTTTAAVTFDTQTFVTDGLHSLSVSADSFIISTPGLYWIGGSLSFATNSAGDRVLTIALNGTRLLLFNDGKASTSGTHFISVLRPTKLAPVLSTLIP